MKKAAITYLLILSILFTAFPVAFAEEEPMPLNLGSGLSSYQIIPADGLTPQSLTLNGVSYQPDWTPKGNIILRTEDLLCADEATRMINQGNYTASDFSIGNGRVTPASDAAITMGDINEFLELLNKYRNTNIPGGAKGDLTGLLTSYTSAQNCKGTQEEADALYIEAIKSTLVNYGYLSARMAEAENKEQKTALNTLLNDSRLKALLTKFETHIDRGIYHDYKPSLAASLGIKGNEYILESGGTVAKQLVVNNVWQSPMTAENGYPCPGCGNIPCRCVPPDGRPDVDLEPSPVIDVDLESSPVIN